MTAARSKYGKPASSVYERLEHTSCLLGTFTPPPPQDRVKLFTSHSQIFDKREFSENIYIVKMSTFTIRDWSLITGRGATKWENRGSKTCCALLPLKTVKLFAPPAPFYRVDMMFCAPPPSIWLKLQATA